MAKTEIYPDPRWGDAPCQPEGLLERRRRVVVLEYRGAGSAVSWVRHRTQAHRYARRRERHVPANRIGFENEAVPQPADGSAPTKPSTDWPFQRFSWTDHDADTGDTVSYRVIPVVRAGASLNLVPAEASDWSAAVTLGAELSGSFQPFFNRGFVMSQFIARYLKQQNKTLAQFKTTITDKDDTTIRRFLSGRPSACAAEQLQLAKSERRRGLRAPCSSSPIDELLDAAEGARREGARGPRERIDHERQDRGAGRRAKAGRERGGPRRADCGGVDVEHDHRFISPGPLGHNKFLVRAGRPASRWRSGPAAPTGHRPGSARRSTTAC